MAYEEKNVRADHAALRELVEEYHSQQTPTAVIAGRVIIGFHSDEYDAALHMLEN